MLLRSRKSRASDTTNEVAIALMAVVQSRTVLC